MIPIEWITLASNRISHYIKHTPLTFDNKLNIYLKWENQQTQGSFKTRGALNKVFSLANWEKQTGLVTASAGNHGLGLAFAGKLGSASVTVFASDHAVKSKVEAMRSMGAVVTLVNGGYELAEETAIKFSREHNQVWVSPYNDGQVIAGQGTIGLEILQDNPTQAGMKWIIPVGGGGLLSGIGASLEGLPQKPALIGVQSEASAFMYGIYHRGNQEGVQDLPSLADGLAGAVQSGSITIPMIKKYAQDVILVREDSIAYAIAYAWNHFGQKIEGSGAVGLAAILENKVKSPAVVIITGGNIQQEIHQELLMRFKDA